MQKAVEYTKLHQPFLINDVEAQFLLQDRREVYRILKENDIETPRFAVCDRSSGKGFSPLHIVLFSLQFCFTLQTIYFAFKSILSWLLDFSELTFDGWYCSCPGLVSLLASVLCKLLSVGSAGWQCNSKIQTF